MDDISTARIYLANEAIELGLIDEIGYLNDAVSQAKKLAGLPDNAKLVVYRRTEYPDDNLYNTATRFGSGNLSLISVDFLSAFSQFNTGFYYLWPSAAMNE
jgi:protease-4